MTSGSTNGKSWKIEVHHESTALELLANELPLTTSQIKQAASFGCIWWQPIDQKPRRIRRLKKRLKPGEELHCYYNTAVIKQAIDHALCHSDEQDFSIWLKPRGMFSQGTKWGDANSIARFVEQALQRPTWLVHRLDRMTTGLMILSHKKSLVAAFEKAFTEQTIHKSYVAAVTGKLTSTPLTIDTAIDGKPALTDITAAYYDSALNISLLEITIHSGKKHQIRRHLSELGYPIIGDRLYGDSAKDDLQLISSAIGFADPRDGTRRDYVIAMDTLKSALLPELSSLVDQALAQKVTK